MGGQASRWGPDSTLWPLKLADKTPYFGAEDAEILRKNTVFDTKTAFLGDKVR